jgi:hypothetical protein
MMMDGQFENLRKDLANLHIRLNTVSNDEHVPDIEWNIQTMKERTRSTWNMLLFKRMPMQLTIEMVSASTFWWNSSPLEGGVSETLSPRAIVAGMEIDSNKQCQLKFGTYAQTHKQSDNSTCNLAQQGPSPCNQPAMNREDTISSASVPDIKQHIRTMKEWTRST